MAIICGPQCKLRLRKHIKDFYQIHTYSSCQCSSGSWSSSQPMRNKPSDYNLDKPIILGEFAAVCSGLFISILFQLFIQYNFRLSLNSHFRQKLDRRNVPLFLWEAIWWSLGMANVWWRSRSLQRWENKNHERNCRAQKSKRSWKYFHKTLTEIQNLFNDWNEFYFLQKPTLTTYKPIPVAYWPDGKDGVTIALFSLPKFHTSVSRELNYRYIYHCITLVSLHKPPIRWNSTNNQSIISNNDWPMYISSFA